MNKILFILRDEMSKSEKALQKILSGQQDKNVTFDELTSVLLQAGWKLTRITGSHHIYRAPHGSQISLPKHGKDIKPVYVREARQFLKEQQ